MVAFLPGFQILLWLEFVSPPPISAKVAVFILIV
jgi:hypothetical protein